MTEILHVQGTDIRHVYRDEDQYICLTDIAKRFGDVNLITDWLKNKNTLEFIAVWERLNNPQLIQEKFEQLLSKAGTNRVRIAIKDLKECGCIGIYATAGRYGASFAHKDIATEFCSWLSPEFKLYLIMEIQRLKKLESPELKMERDIRRLVSKANYRIHTDAIKANLIPEEISAKRKGFIYANEADVLNVAVFGMTASEWRGKHPGAKGNIRDDEDLCTIYHLIVLSNLESLNATLIDQGLDRGARAVMLNREARRQMESLTHDQRLAQLQPSPLLSKS